MRNLFFGVYVALVYLFYFTTGAAFVKVTMNPFLELLLRNPALPKATHQAEIVFCLLYGAFMCGVCWFVSKRLSPMFKNVGLSILRKD